MQLVKHTKISLFTKITEGIFAFHVFVYLVCCTVYVELLIRGLIVSESVS